MSTTTRARLHHAINAWAATRSGAHTLALNATVDSVCIEFELLRREVASQAESMGAAGETIAQPQAQVRDAAAPAVLQALEDLTIAYRALAGLDGAWDQPLIRAERVLIAARATSAPASQEPGQVQPSQPPGLTFSAAADGRTAGHPNGAAMAAEGGEAVEEAVAQALDDDVVVGGVGHQGPPVEVAMGGSVSAVGRVMRPPAQGEPVAPSLVVTVEMIAAARKRIRAMHEPTPTEHAMTYALVDAIAAAPKAAPPQGEPMFWVRLRSDGGYEGPIHNDSIERVRRLSGAWHPLFVGAAPAPVAQGEPVAPKVPTSQWPIVKEAGRIASAQLGYYRDMMAAHAPVAAQPCEWRLVDVDNGIWSAACDPVLMYSFTEGGPIENGHKHCHACGRPLAVAQEGGAA